MIAAHEDASDGLGAGDDFVGIAAVTDSVAKIDDEIMSGSGSETGVQRFEIAMNVAEEKDTHGKVRIIALWAGKDEADGSQFSVEMDLIRNL